MKNERQTWWQPAIVIFARFSAWILLPLLVGVPLGQWLDKKYGSEPWLFLAAVGASFLVSTVGLVVSAIKEFKEIGEELENKKYSQNQNGNNSGDSNH